MDRVLLVDGSNLLFQMFFGMPKGIMGRSGRAMQGTLGFVGALRKMLRWVQPTHAAVWFDGEHENPRAAVDAAYKANRPALCGDESPFSQLADVYAALDVMGIVHAETTVCETDDWIAAYARRGEGREIVIASMDSDFFQLLGEKVSVLRYRGERTALWTEATLREKLGVAPGQYAAYKALTGDAADNLRGAPGVGPKTAAKLLACFGTLEGVLAHAEQVRPLRLRAALTENAERLRRNDALIRLEGEAALPYAWEALRWEECALTTGQILRAIGL